MTLTIEDVVTQYIFSRHPKNKAIVDIKDKETDNLRYIKIRHRLSNIYAVSLVDPVTFEVWAETQAKNAATKIKPIVLHITDKKGGTSVEFLDTSRIGFEWTFTWEDEKYKWVRESRMSKTLKCEAVRKTGNICVAQYLPCILKDEYFGIFSLLGYNMLRCKLTKSRELELIIIMSLMTLLDKSNDGEWKRDLVSQEVQDATPDQKKDAKKTLQKKSKKELLNDQKVQLLLEKEVKRTQKQIQTDQRQYMNSLSADNSPSHTPKMSPLPTPSSSASILRSPRLTRQKSVVLNSAPSSSNEPQSSRFSQKLNQSPILDSEDYPLRRQRSQKQLRFQLDYDHQLSLPIGYEVIRNNNNPPSLNSIMWNNNPELNDQYYHRRLSGSEYAYNYHSSTATNRYSSSEYYMPSYNPFDYYH